MSWAAKRRFIILLIIGAIGVAFFTVVSITIFYETPSCTDGVQNQNEAGIDCGGPCRYLCTAQMQPPTVLFTKELNNGAGRTDIIAMVQNKNADAAAKNIPYHITLYGKDHFLLREIDGTFDLPPRATEPIYLVGVTSGNQTVASAFLEVAASAPQWYRANVDPRIVPTVARTTRSGTSDAPRIEAVLTNPSLTTLSNIRVVVLVRDSRKSVIAASETIIPTLAAQEEASAIFTWSSAFSGVPASIEVVPVIPLP